MAPARQYANHPDPMDLWLETQGYYRKSTAREGSCLFRAISEQIYYTQKFHLDVRKQCVEYLKSHVELFVGHNIDSDVETYLEHMQSPTQWGSSLEIAAMSHFFKVDIWVFKDVGVPALKAIDTSYGKKLMLCFSHDRHYDSVYHKEFTKSAGFCQSLVYEVLYKNVFRMKDVDYAVEKMLHHKPNRRDLGCGPRKLFSYSCNSIQLQRKGVAVDSVLDDEEINVRDLLMKGITPFPYKVAKSLDPNIFRNVEFDVWIDYRRGLRQGYFGSNSELRVGVKCLVTIDDNSCVAHIQEMDPNKGPVVVFVEELGEKRTVPFESLELIPQEPPAPKQLITNHSSLRNMPSSHSKAIVNSFRESSNGSKSRKGKGESDFKRKNSSRGASGRGSPIGSKRSNSTSDWNCITESNSDMLTSTCDFYQDANVTSFSSFTVDSYGANGGYQNPYQVKSLEIGMTLPIQTHVLMQSQQHSPQILIPVSPRPEDVPAHWLSPNETQDSSSTNLSPTGFSSVPYNPAGDTNPTECMSSKDESAEGIKDYSVQDGENEVANYMSISNMQGEQINFNAPKSVLDDGADLPITDIQTLRFFYNLGNEVFHSHCNAYGWGGYSQPCAATSPSSPNPPGMCSGKCVCGPVCITTVPTIHHLLEPTTPPISGRRKRKDSSTAGGQTSSVNEAEPSSTSTGSQASSSIASSSVSPRFKAKGKNKKDSKGQQHAYQPTLQIPSFEDTTNSDSQNNGLLNINCDHTSPNLSVPYSPTYGYVYYPSSPVVPYSPIDGEPYFTPLRVQFPTEYLPDTPQSPQCFSLNGDMSVSQYPMIATSPHYLVPASPGIYVGSPPAWSPMTPTTPQ